MANWIVSKAFARGLRLGLAMLSGLVSWGEVCAQDQFIIFDPWVLLDGRTPSAPAVVYDAVGTLHVFVRGTDNGIWHRTRTADGTLSGWQAGAGGATLSGVAASLDPTTGDIQVVARGTDNGIWLNTLTPGGLWTGWTSVGGATQAGLGIATDATGQTTLAARGLETRVWLKHEPKGFGGDITTLSGVWVMGVESPSSTCDFNSSFPRPDPPVRAGTVLVDHKGGADIKIVGTEGFVRLSKGVVALNGDFTVNASPLPFWAYGHGGSVICSGEFVVSLTGNFLTGQVVYRTDIDISFVAPLEDCASCSRVYNHGVIIHHMFLPDLDIRG